MQNAQTATTKPRSARPSDTGFALRAIGRILFDEAEEHRTATLAYLDAGVAVVVDRAFTAKDEAGREHTVTEGTPATVVTQDIEFVKDFVHGSVTLAVTTETGASVNLTIKADDCHVSLVAANG